MQEPPAETAGLVHVLGLKRGEPVASAVNRLEHHWVVVEADEAVCSCLLRSWHVQGGGRVYACT